MKSVAGAQKKALEAATKAKESWQKVEKLQAKKDMPPNGEKVQMKANMDVKTPGGLVVQVEAIKKPENSNKV